MKTIEKKDLKLKDLFTDYNGIDLTPDIVQFKITQEQCDSLMADPEFLLLWRNNSMKNGCLKFSGFEFYVED